MKFNKNFTIVILVFFATAIIGCSDSDTSTSSGGGLPTGNLLGQISGLMDSLGSWQSDFSGVAVEAIGSGISAQSDSKGYWELKNLPSRTYDIRFSKPGYVDYYCYGYSFLGGATSSFSGQTCFLLMQPSFTVSMDAMTISLAKGQLYGTLYAHASPNIPDLNLAYVYAVFGTSPTIDMNDNSTFKALYYFSGNMNRDQATKSLTMDNWSLNDTTLFHSGETVYCRLYPFYYTISYFNPNNKKTIFTGIGSGSNVLSQVLP